MELSSVQPDQLVESPFRQIVTTPEFERIESSQKLIHEISGLNTTPEDSPSVASMIASEIFFTPADHEPAPDEVKLEAFKQINELMKDPREPSMNIEIANMMIDIIRSVKRPSLRLRLAGMLSRSVQEQFYSDVSPDAFDTDLYFAFEARKGALSLLAHDNLSPAVNRKWAEALINPGEAIRFFSSMYDHTSSEDLTIKPHVLEEIIDDTPSEKQEEKEETEMLFSGHIVRLRPPCLPTEEKGELFKRMTGRSLPLALVHKEGAEFHYIDFPDDLSSRAMDLASSYRRGEKKRSEVFAEAGSLQAEWLGRMNEEQRAELENYNLHIRFSTERGVRVPEDTVEEPVPLPTYSQNVQEQAAAD